MDEERDEEQKVSEQVGQENTREQSSTEFEVESDKDDGYEEAESVGFHCNKAYFRRTCLSLNIYWRTLFLFIGVSVYILIGGAIFTAVERPNELKQNQAMEEANHTYYLELIRLVNLLEDNTNLTTEQATRLVETVGMAAVNVSSISVTDNWNYGSAVFFTTTVVTTIGEKMLV